MHHGNYTIPAACLSEVACISRVDVESVTKWRNVLPWRCTCRGGRSMCIEGKMPIFRRNNTITTFKVGIYRCFLTVPSSRRGYVHIKSMYVPFGARVIMYVWYFWASLLLVPVSTPQNILGSWYEFVTDYRIQISRYLMEAQALTKLRGGFLNMCT